MNSASVRMLLLTVAVMAPVAWIGGAVYAATELHSTWLTLGILFLNPVSAGAIIDVLLWFVRRS